MGVIASVVAMMGNLHRVPELKPLVIMPPKQDTEKTAIRRELKKDRKKRKKSRRGF
jgi:hypothetical protein